MLKKIMEEITKEDDVNFKIVATIFGREYVDWFNAKDEKDARKQWLEQAKIYISDVGIKDAKLKVTKIEGK